MEKVKCLIIGSGPAGYTAAIYTSRANLNPVLYEGIEPGGQLTTTTEIDNYPGYPEGIDGNQLMGHMRKQAERFGADIRRGTVTRADLSSRPFHLVVDGEKQIEADSLIIATGASARYLGLPATASSTARRTWRSWAAATLPARRPPIWLRSAGRST